MDLGLVRILRCEEGVELLLGVNFLGVLAAEGEGTVEQGLLDFGQDLGDAVRQRVGGQEFLLLWPFVAACHGGTARLQIARADLDTDGHPLLDPLPALYPATEVAGVDLHAYRLTGVGGGPDSGADLLGLG